LTQTAPAKDVEFDRSTVEKVFWMTQVTLLHVDGAWEEEINAVIKENSVDGVFKWSVRVEDKQIMKERKEDLVVEVDGRGKWRLNGGGWERIGSVQ
jgi:hypothetical protein